MTATRKERPWNVYLNGTISSYAVLDVTCSVGARSVQSARFRYKPTKAVSMALLHEGKELRDLFTNGTRVDITRQTKNGTETTVHVGYVVGGKVAIDPAGGETIVVTSRLDDYLMSEGKTVGKLSWGNSTVFDNKHNYSVIDLDLIVNPIVNGSACKNRFRDDSDSDDIVILPVDPDSLPDDWKDHTEYSSKLDYWSLAELIYYLLSELNKSQTYIESPTLAELEAQLGSDRNLLRHFLVDRGQFLPKIFDALTIPYGFSWMYTYFGVNNKPQLYFWQRNTAGTKASVPLAPSGSVVNINPDDGSAPLSESDRFNVTLDVTNRAANKIVAVGDFEEYEFTAELVPAWDPALDDTPSKELVEGSDEMLANPKLRRVYRDWVLNETNEYRSFASHANRQGGRYESGLSAPHDFSGVFGTFDYLFRRRHLEKTITIHDDKIGGPAGIYNGVRVDVFAKKLDGTWGWTTPAKLGLSVQILKNEVGVRLGSTKEGPDVVRSLFHPLEATDTFRVKITGTVKSDQRVRPDSVTTHPSLIVQSKELEINVGRKYAFRKVSDSSLYHGIAGYKTREYDATAELNALSTQLSDSWNVATIGGTISIEGTDSNSEYLGWDITGFQTRNFTLRATAGDDATHELYPNVVAVKYDVQRQKTLLTLDVFRQDLRTV